VLELGCGDGGNALSIGQSLPGAQVLGIDAAAAAIERGVALARAAGLQERVGLRAATFEELDPEQLGRFDYVVAHGVYSWIPPATRGALLACVRRCLAPQGIAFVSYNAYPGSYLRDMARDVLRYHLRDVHEPEAQLRGAHELMEAIVAIEEPSPFARVLREHLERMLGYSDALLFHDDLAQISTPFYFHELVEHAAAHGLQFLSEAELSESQMRDVPASAAALMEALPADAVVREQYLDFFKNRMFRQTLLCHGEVDVQRALDDRVLERLWVASGARAEQDPTLGGDETFTTLEGYAMTTSEPHVRAAMHALAAAAPGAVEFASLARVAVDAAGPGVAPAPVVDRLREVLLQAYLARVVTLLGGTPPLAVEPGERPLASPLARAQHAAGARAVSSLAHENVRLDGDLDPALIALLDGTRDRATLAAALGRPADEVGAALGRLATVGLLAA
jgi:SAM-dependent methyltransferase